MRISPNALWSLLGVLGAALSAFPEARLAGLMLIAAAILVFVFQVGIESGGVHAHPSRTRMMVTGGIALSVLAFAGWYFWPQIEEATASCKLNTTVSSRIVSRLHGRRSIPTSPAMDDFQFQELFYEWRFDIKPIKPVQKVFIEISHLDKDEIIKAQPEDSNISDLKQKWMSGFPESRTTPDFFAQTITFGALDKDQPASIVIRRRLLVPQIAPIQIITVEDVRAPDCTIIKPDIDEKYNSAYLTKQAIAFSKERFGKSAPETGLPISKDLGDVPPGEMEDSIEGWCANAECTQFTFANLEVRLGRQK
jgi:hypothetical protein